MKHIEYVPLLGRVQRAAHVETFTAELERWVHGDALVLAVSCKELLWNAVLVTDRGASFDACAVEFALLLSAHICTKPEKITFEVG